MIAVVAWLVLLIATPSAYIAGTAAPALAGPDDFTLDKSGPEDALIGELIEFTLTATGSQSADLYNISFRDVLPPGVEFVSGDPSPVVIADEPSPGFTTLVWENVSDLPTGSQSSVSYTVDTDPDTNPATLPVGTSFTNSAEAVGNSDAFVLPAIDPATGTFTGGFTGEADATTDTPIIAYRLEKIPLEGEILRGVHGNTMGTAGGGTVGTTYEIVVEGNPNYDSVNFTVSDTMNPFLEFLGCDNYYAADNTTDVPLNGAAIATEEWVGSGPVFSPPATPNCLTPTLVDTLPSGQTVVEWTFPTLAAGATETIEYGVGIAMRANCDTWPAGKPAAGGLTQGRNLDNNCGEPTNEHDMAPWPNPGLPELLGAAEEPLENVASTCGAYTQVTGPAYDPCQTDEAIVEQEDLRLGKSMVGSLQHSAALANTLTAEASEYRDFQDLTFRDLLPSGTCYTGTFLSDITAPPSDWATNDCPGAGSVVPTISIDGGAPIAAPATTVQELADGRFEIVWSFTTLAELGALSSDSTVSISFGSVVRTTYRAGFAPTTPVLSGDSLENTAEVYGPDFRTTENSNDEGIDDDPADETGNPDGDTASASIDSALPSIKKYVSVKSPGPLDQNTAPMPNTPADCAAQYGAITWEDSAGGAPTPTDVNLSEYGPGDLVCFALTADFPPGIDYGGVQITDLLPPGYTYIPGSAARITTSTTNVSPSGSIPADTMPGASVVSEADRKVVFDVGPVSNSGNSFVWVIGAILGPPGSNAPGDITLNQQKMTTVNTAGNVFQFRDMAGVIWEEPIVQIAKGVESITSISGDVDAPGPQGIDFDNSYFDDVPTAQEVEGAALVEFRLDIWNEGNRDAANVEVWDTIPPEFTCADISNISNGGVCAAGVITWPPTLTVPENFDSVSYRPAAGDFQTYTYDLTVPGNVAPGQFYLNEAGIRSYESESNLDSGVFTFYPEDNIDPTVTPNTADADDQAQLFTVAPTLNKTQWSGIDDAGNSSNGSLNRPADDATIGEIVQYQLSLTIPEGTTIYDGVLSDQIPAGMTWFEGSGLFDGAVSTLTPSIEFVDAGGLPVGNDDPCGDPTLADLLIAGAAPADGDTGEFELTFPCDYLNDTGSGDDILLLTFYLQVDDDPANQADPQTALRNRGQFSYGDELGNNQTPVNSNTVQIDVVEPNPEIVKTHTTPVPPNNSILPGGNAVWNLSVTNSSATAANVTTLHDLEIVDTVPLFATPLATPGGTPVTATGDTVEGPGGAIGIWDATARTITWTTATPWNPAATPHILDELAPDGGPIVLDFEVEFDSFIPSGQIIFNSAEVTGDSLSPEDPSNDPSDQDARPYGDSDGDFLTPVTPSLDKDVEPFGSPDVDDTTFTVGEPVEYSVTFTIPDGTVAYDATLFDTLPAGLTFDSFSNTGLGATPLVGPGCFSGSETAITGPLDPNDFGLINPTAGDPQVVAWFFGDVVASGEACEITVPYTVHVNDTSFDTNLLTNRAESAWNTRDEVDDSTVTTDLPPAYDDPSEFDLNPPPVTETITVVEPSLELDKDVALQPGATTIAPCDTTPGNDTSASNDPDGTPGTNPSGGVDGDGCDVEAGASMQYTLTLTSTGTSPAYDITVVDEVPPGIEPTLPIANGGVWDAGTREISWLLVGPIDPGDTFQLVYDAELSYDPALPFDSDDFLDGEDLTNTAGVPFFLGIPATEQVQIIADNPANDDLILYGSDPTADRGPVDPDDVTLEVHFPEVEIVKSAVAPSDETDARIGEPFTWQLVIRNTDSVASLYGVDATDTLPPGWTYIPGSATVTVDNPGPGTPTPVEPTCAADTGACNDPAALNEETLTWTDLISGTDALGPGETITITLQAIPQLDVLDDPIYYTPANLHTNDATTAGDDAAGNDSCCGGTPYEDDDSHDVVLNEFDLALRKTVFDLDPDPLRIGSEITFDIEVFNQGTVDAFDVEITDYVPAELTFLPSNNTAALTGNANAWGGSASAATLDIPFIAAGTSETVKIVLVFSTPPVAGSLIDNVAEISSADDDNDPGTPGPNDNDSTPDAINDDELEDDEIDENGVDDTTGDGIADEDDHDIASVTVFDLALEKTVNTIAPLPIGPTSVVTFDIEVFNQGSVAATDVVVTDYVQSGFTFAAADNTAAATGNAADWDGTDPLNPTLDVGSIPAGASVTVSIILAVDASSAPLENFAEISSFDDDGDPLTPPPGDIDSDADSTNDETPDDGVIDETGIDATGPTGDDEDDHDIAVIDIFDLALRKTINTVAPTPIVIGSLVTFDIEVFNQGSIDATDIVVTDYVKPGFVFNAADNTAAATGNAADWDGTDPLNPTLAVGNVAAGTSETATIVLEFTGTPPGGVLVNNAEISSADDDGDPLTTAPTDFDSTPDGTDSETPVDDEIDNTGGDEDDHDTALIDTFDLALRKTVLEAIPSPPVIGTAVTFQIEVFNQGSIDATDIVITDYVQNGFTFEPADNTAAATGNAEDWDGTDPLNPTLLVGAIPAGGSATVTIVLDVADASVFLTNVAEISSADDDGDPLTTAPTDVDSVPDAVNDDEVEDDEIGENGQDDTTGDGVADQDDHDIAVLSTFDLALRKTVNAIDPSPVTIGSLVSFNIEVFNQGSIDATDIVVTDYVQPGFAFRPADNTAAVTGNAADWDGTDPLLPTLAVGSIPAGSSVTVRIVLEVIGGAPMLDNAAEISSFDDDGDPSTPAPSDVDSTADATDDDVVENDEIDENGIDDETGDGLADEDDHDITTMPVFDLATRKVMASFAPSPLADGGLVTFEVEVFNQGSIDATDIVITDYIQPGFTFVAADNTALVTGNTEDWDGTDPLNPTLLVGSLAAGESITVSIVLQVPVVPTTPETFENHVEISSYDDDGDPLTTAPSDIDSTADAIDDDLVEDDETGENGRDDTTGDGVADEDDHDIATITFPFFDLALTKQLPAGAPTVVDIGDEVTFEITVINQGLMDATDVLVTDYLPAGLELSSADTNGWTSTGPGVVEQTIAGPILIGDSITIEITTTVLDSFSGDQVNVAEIGSGSDINGVPRVDIDSTPDADGGNDAGGDPAANDNVVDGADGDEDDHDPALVRIREVDLTIEKALTSTAFEFGTDVTWELSVTNNGPDPDLGPITVTDVLPAGLRFVSASGDGWTCTIVDRTLTCVSATGADPAETMPAITLTTTVIGEAGERVTNSAEVSSTFTDVVDTNNTDTDDGVVTVRATTPLAFTGGNVGILLAIALTLLGAGIFLLGIRRQQSTQA